MESIDPKSALAEALRDAEKYRWTVTADTLVYEFRRRRGRSVERVRVMFDVYGRVVSGSWSPTLNGIGGLAAPGRGKRQWIRGRLAGVPIEKLNNQ
ncbi:MULTISPECIES: hypothetical protein [unclassified Nocardia]|uniref:hypothetical protein n=1 Tax=unclassified Nocardia TaxID=2637762 RepID=UPI001CE3C1A5|nr:MULTISPECIES: hypothetical protein [unclassified Nocardia]